ncbi:hypothetical protein ABZW03_37565, partial [Kitasatospora sp. NPDC004799]
MTDQQNSAPAVWDPTARGGAGGWVRGPQRPADPQSAGSTPVAPTAPQPPAAPQSAAHPGLARLAGQGVGQPVVEVDQAPVAAV